MRQKASPETTDQETAPTQSSALFSLRELMDDEAKRAAEELARREAREVERIAARERARVMAEQKADADARARAQAVAEERLAREARARHEQAEGEALKVAAIERLRLEAAEKSRLQVMSMAQAHERELEALKNDIEKRRLRTIIGVVTVSGVLFFGSALGLYFGKIRPDAETERARFEARAAAQADETERLKNEARQEEARLQALPKVSSAPPLVVSAAPIEPPHRVPGQPPKLPPTKVCPKGVSSLDPLNECL